MRNCPLCAVEMERATVNVYVPNKPDRLGHGDYCLGCGVLVFEREEEPHHE